MKLILTCATIAALFMTATPAPARVAPEWIAKAVGQDVYDLRNTRVGKLERYIDVRGTPGVIIAASNRTFIAPAEDLVPRDAGGLLLMRSDAGVARLQTYQPGRLPFW